MFSIEIPELRINDKWGAGHYGASRGSRKHNGVDFKCLPNLPVSAFFDGVVTYVGHAYGDDLSFRYIEIKNKDGFYNRYFYVRPHENIQLRKEVKRGELLGVTQKLGGRYEGITEHYHYEVFAGKDGRKPAGYVNPIEYYVTSMYKIQVGGYA